MKPIFVPLQLFVLPAVLIALAPTHHALLVLDRTALTNGEIWRLWSGHWVHFSGSHVSWNLVALLVAGTWLEKARPGLLLRHTLVAAPAIGLAILAGEPGLQSYGGLSGLATSLVVLLGLHQLNAPESPRWLWVGVLGLVAVKIFGEAHLTTPLLATFSSPLVRSSTTAHAAGAIVAVLHYGHGRFAFHKMAPPGPVAGSRRQGSG